MAFDFTVISSAVNEASRLECARVIIDAEGEPVDDRAVVNVSTQRWADLDLVAGVAADLDDGIAVTLESNEIVIRKGRVEERYDTAEEAIAGLRASWGRS